MHTVESSKVKLIVMSHPDDPELSCGGSIAGWTENSDVYFIITSSGDKGGWNNDKSPFKTAVEREEEAVKAAEFLNIKKVIFLRHPDGFINDISTLKLEIAALIRKLNPGTIVTNDPWSHHFHPDHRATANAVIKAIMIARDWHFYPFLKEIDLEPYSPDELLLTPTERPNYFNDISDTIEKKIKAIGIHSSQIERWEGWDEYIRKRAGEEGKKAGFKYAESFYRMKL